MPGLKGKVISTAFSKLRLSGLISIIVAVVSKGILILSGASLTEIYSVELSAPSGMLSSTPYKGEETSSIIIVPPTGPISPSPSVYTGGSGLVSLFWSFLHDPIEIIKAKAEKKDAKK
ncbi:MAG: hypothetical protein K9G67_06300 [Bacteroidales bacterium]|nr:hypothetical protein [Bacteroidales bacterium]MCF8375948.1 hypothetical protein [Bacteroidales bacterium]